MGFFRKLLNVADATGQGLAAADRAKVENEDRQREIEQAALERALLEFNLEEARRPPKPPTPTYGVNPEGRPTMSGGSLDDVNAFTAKYRPPKPEAPEAQTYDVDIDGMHGSFRTPEEAAEFRNRYRVADEPETPGSNLTGTQAQAAAQNRATVARIDDVIRMIEGRPESLGLRFKLPEFVTQRADPEGVEVRAIIADIASLQIADRSGANVPVMEMERLKPFVPSVTDTPEAAIVKLRQLQAGIQAVLDETGGTVRSSTGSRTGGPMALDRGGYQMLGSKSDDEIYRQVMEGM